MKYSVYLMQFLIIRIPSVINVCCWFASFMDCASPSSVICACRIWIYSAKIVCQSPENGFSVQHPIQPREHSALVSWLALRPQYLEADSDFLFLSRQGRLSRQQMHRLFREYGELAGLNVPVHPHMLRHACGYALADDGIDTRLIQDYLGHKNIQNTVIYTASNAGRFRSIRI